MMTPPRLTSLPVPEVVGMATIGATALVILPAPPSTNEYGCSDVPGCVAIRPTALARSIGEPPPIAMMPSQPSDLYSFSASRIAASVGFSGVSSYSVIGMLPGRRSLTLPHRPAATTPLSVTTSGRRMPSSCSSASSSDRAPKSNWIRVR